MKHVLEESLSELTIIDELMVEKGKLNRRVRSSYLINVDVILSFIVASAEGKSYQRI